VQTSTTPRTAPGRPVRRAGIPTGQERRFSPDELIVSKTDLQGRITYANDVFLRVGAYDLCEVIGQPHNVIRHPDMPRAVFALLWQTLKEGREIFAYINNLAADGANYWVLAHVTPSFDERGKVVGYHSNRRCPRTEGLSIVRPIYERLLREEQQRPNAKAALAASVPLFSELVGHDYERFIWSIAREGE